LRDSEVLLGLGCRGPFPVCQSLFNFQNRLGKEEALSCPQSWPIKTG